MDYNELKLAIYESVDNMFINEANSNTSSDKKEEKKEKRKVIAKKIAKGAIYVGSAAGIAYGAHKAIEKGKEFDKNKKELTDSDFSKLRNKLEKIEKDNDKALSDADELEKEFKYKEGISKLSKVKLEAISLKHDILDYSSSDKRNSLITTLNNIIKKNDSKLKKLNDKTKNSPLNNKYWINYTKEHNKAFRETEKKLRGFNTKQGMRHDMDKYFMYHVLPAPIAHALHTQFARHHKRRARTKEDYIQMMIDWECARKTKPDKQMKPYEVLDKFYPELKSTMIPIFREYGLPTNAAEDREMSKQKGK